MQEDKPQPPSAEIVEALRDVVEARGWVLIGWSNGAFTAELPGSIATQVASASDAGLVRAIDSYVQRQGANNVDFVALSGPPVAHGVIDVDEQDEEEDEE